MRLQDKVALVTGSSEGIGRGIVTRLAQEGAKVIVNYRSKEDAAHEALQEVQAVGGDGFIIQADVSQMADIKRLVAETVAHYGQIDILVNNAGVEKNAPFWEVTEEDYDRVLNTNLKGVFFMTQAVVQHMIERKIAGKIINISSVHEELPFPHFTAYCASKGGVKMMTRNLSIELAEFGITINSIAPGAIETPINSKLLNDPPKLKALLDNIPLKRLGKPQDVAGVAAFLASSDAGYITGTTTFIDGGLTWNYQEQ